MSTIVNLHNAVVALLNAHTFSIPFVATAKWMAFIQLGKLNALVVTVVPGPTGIVPLDRRCYRHTQAMDVVIQKKINPDIKSDIDNLIGLCEEIIKLFYREAVPLVAACTGQTFVAPADAAVSGEDLVDHRIFTSVIRTTWQMLQ